MDIISTQVDPRSRDYHNIITKKLDMKLKNQYKKHLRQGYHDGTTMQFDDTLQFNRAYIRFPGATRGYLFYNNDNIILEIFLDDVNTDECVYKKEVLKDLNKFIGCRLIMPTNDSGNK
jgi:hypothetical protein